MTKQRRAVYGRIQARGRGPGVLSINSNRVSRWQRELTTNSHAAFPGNGKLIPDQQRIQGLERQVQPLEMEKAILKKATVFFASARR